MIDDLESSEVVVYLKKILKSSGCKVMENYVNGSDLIILCKFLVLDFLMGIDVSDYLCLFVFVKCMNIEFDWFFVIFIFILICRCD